MSNDMDQHVNLPLASSFLKNYGQEILGIVPRKQRAAAAQHDEEQQPENVVEGAEEKETKTDREESAVRPECRALMKELFIAYYRSVEKHLIKDHKYIKKLDHRNRETLFARGELSEETKQNYEKVSKAYEKLLNNTQT